MAVINTIDLTGVSADGWREAANEALREASRTIRHITRCDVVRCSAVVEDVVITEYHTELRLFFDVETR